LPADSPQRRGGLVHPRRRVSWLTLVKAGLQDSACALESESSLPIKRKMRVEFAHSEQLFSKSRN